jgi:hypothetical protein
VSPCVLAATAKARAAKAAKKALLEPGLSRTSATQRRSGPLQARKAATSEPGRKKAPTAHAKKSVLGMGSRNDSNASDSDMDAEASNNEVPPIGESQDTQTTVSTQFVPDSDEEDDKFILPDTQEEEDFDIPISDAEEDTAVEDTPRRPGPGRPRRRTSDVAPVFALKKRVKKMGGARPGAGRKRRRPSVVVNSDDE